MVVVEEVVAVVLVVVGLVVQTASFTCPSLQSDLHGGRGARDRKGISHHRYSPPGNEEVQK